MKKKLFFLRILFVGTTLFLSTYLFCQGDITISIQDSVTQEPLRFATAYFKKNNHIGYVTNLNGEFTISPKSSKFFNKTDTLICAYVGYEEIRMPIDLRQLQAQQLAIKLPPKTIILQEVEVVVIKKNLTPLQIIKKAIKAIPTNYANESVYLETFYRELIQEKGKYIQLNEAFATLNYTSYTQKKFHKKAWRHYWKESVYKAAYEFGYGKHLFQESQSFHYFNTIKDQAKIIAARASANWSAVDAEPAPEGGILGMTAADKVKYLYDFLDKKNFNKYHYQLSRVAYYNEIPCYIISFYPKSFQKTVHQNIAKKMNFAIFTGNLYIDINSFSIVGFECQTSNIADFSIYEQHLPFKTSIKIDYQKKGTKWYLSKIQTNQLHRLKHKNKTILYECDRELIVNKIITENVRAFNNKAQLLEQKNYAAIRFFADDYKPKLWEQLIQQKQYPKLSKKAKTDLEAKRSLEHQFKEWFTQESLSPPKNDTDTSYVYLHEDTLIDPYKNLETESSETLQYLKAENNYFKNYMIPSRKGRKNFRYTVGLLASEDTTSYNYTLNDFTYFWDDSATNFPALYRKKDTIQELVLDIRKQIQGTKVYLENYEINPSNQYVAYSLRSLDSIGSTVYIQQIGAHPILSKVCNVDDFKWIGEQAITYSSQNKQRRVNKLYTHPINGAKDRLLFEEKDTTYDLSFQTDKSLNYLILTSESLDETEIHVAVLQQEELNLHTFVPRIKGHKYSILPEKKRFLILTNWEAPNFRLMETPINNTQLAEWKEVIPESSTTFIDDFLTTNDYIVTKSIEDAQPLIHQYNKATLKKEPIKLPAKNLSVHFDNQKDINSNTVNLNYASSNVPYTTVALNLETQNRQVTYQSPLHKDIDLTHYEVEQIMVKTDGKETIPMTVSYHKQHSKLHKGLILKVYGAYGALSIPVFELDELLLLNKGFTIVYAHVRGSRAKGELWYQQGKLLNKKNTFQDYLACANYLINNGYTSPDYLVGYGQSAGGLVMGYVMNEQPDLFKALILDYPYLDVINTMRSELLPLTNPELKEWGNPKQKTHFEYIKSYSPYQNIKPQRYPNLLFFAGLKDFQTPYWQIAKTVAKLRVSNTAENDILFRTNLLGGHAGEGGENWLQQSAYQYAFIIQSLFGSIEAFEVKYKFPLN